MTDLTPLDHRSLAERELLEAVLDSVEDGILACDAAGTVTLFSYAGRWLPELPDDPLPIDGLAETYPFFLADGETPMRPADNPLARALAGETVRELEFVIAPAGCRRRVVVASGRPLVDPGGRPLGAVVALHDVTERRRLETILGASERRGQAIFTTHPSAILHTEADGTIVEANPAAEALLGYRPGELTGHRLVSLCAHELAHDELVSAVRERPERAVTDRELALRRSDGATVACEVSGVALRDAGGGLAGCTWTIRDLSERKQVEQSLAEARQRLASSREEERLRIARELHDGSVQELIGIGFRLAEIRTELAASGGGERPAALEPALYGLQRDVVAVVRQLRSVISDLRPAGLAEFGFEEVLQGHIAKLARGRARAFPEVELRIPAAVDALPQPVVLCLFRAAQEAIGNAAKHADAGRISVCVECGEHQVTLVVNDDGVGFEVPSSLAELVRRDHFGLAGIGERVELIGGAMQLRSTPGAGTELTVTLPLSPAGA